MRVAAREAAERYLKASRPGVGDHGRAQWERDVETLAECLAQGDLVQAEDVQQMIEDRDAERARVMNEAFHVPREEGP
jgi:hypothetical protein